MTPSDLVTLTALTDRTVGRPDAGEKLLTDQTIQHQVVAQTARLRH
jgi:hypothetical protein